MITRDGQENKLEKSKGEKNTEKLSEKTKMFNQQIELKFADIAETDCRKNPQKMQTFKG